MTRYRLCGSPVHAAIAALALHARGLGDTVTIDMAALEHAEGELVGFGDDVLAVPSWFTGLATAIWPGFTVKQSDGATNHAGAIALIDPLQCLLALSELYTTPPEPAQGDVLVNLAAPDKPTAPAQMLSGAGLDGLRLPVVFEPEGAAGAYRQILPLGDDLVMMRRRWSAGGAAGLAAALRRPGWAFAPIGQA